jgi:hypothetical protein
VLIELFGPQVGEQPHRRSALHPKRLCAYLGRPTRRRAFADPAAHEGVQAGGVRRVETGVRG